MIFGLAQAMGRSAIEVIGEPHPCLVDLLIHCHRFTLINHTLFAENMLHPLTDYMLIHVNINITYCVISIIYLRLNLVLQAIPQLLISWAQLVSVA